MQIWFLVLFFDLFLVDGKGLKIKRLSLFYHTQLFPPQRSYQGRERGGKKGRTRRDCVRGADFKCTQEKWEEREGRRGNDLWRGKEKVRQS